MKVDQWIKVRSLNSLNFVSYKINPLEIFREADKSLFINQDYLRKDVKIKSKKDKLFEFNNKLHIKKIEFKYQGTSIFKSLSSLGGTITVLKLFFTCLSMPFSYIEFNIALAREYFNKGDLYDNKVEIDVDCATYLKMLSNLI